MIYSLQIGPSDSSRGRWSMMCRNMGSRKAMVFPLPVLAMPMRSLPVMMAGIAWAWIGVGFSQPCLGTLHKHDVLVCGQKESSVMYNLKVIISQTHLFRALRIFIETPHCTQVLMGLGQPFPFTVIPSSSSLYAFTSVLIRTSQTERRQLGSEGLKKKKKSPFNEACSRRNCCAAFAPRRSVGKLCRRNGRSLLFRFRAGSGGTNSAEPTSV